MAELTRVDTEALRSKIEQVSIQIESIMDDLTELVVIGADDRSTLFRPPAAFSGAARELAKLMNAHPDIAETTGYDAEAVEEDLDNVDILAPLEGSLTELMQRIQDSRLLWLAEAFVQSAAAYKVARALSQSRPELRRLIQTLAPVFGRTRTRTPPLPSTPPST